MNIPEFVTAEEAVSAIENGAHIHLGSIANVPHILVEAICERLRRGEVQDLHFHHFHTEGEAPYGSAELDGKCFDQGFFVGHNLRKSVLEGYADYIPVNLFTSQRLYRDHVLPCDVALVQVSEPDSDGMVSLGTSIDCTIAALEVAKTAIAVVNPNVPYSYGEAIPLSRFNYLVRDDRELDTTEYVSPSEVQIALGKVCAELINDGDCLQMGIGAFPNAVAKQLSCHKDLGIHSEMFADGVLELIKKGVVNGSKKGIDKGKIVASFILGSKELYDFIDHNPDVQMRDIRYTNDPSVIALNPNMVSINSATQIDLTGQVCADSIGERIISGTGGQLDFVRGAARSQGGKSVIALASRTKNGVGKIVPILAPGAGVVTPRADVQWIATEYGAVNLFGKSLQERARLLISIAHPDDREALEEAAFKRFGPHFLRIK